MTLAPRRPALHARLGLPAPAAASADLEARLAAATGAALDALASAGPAFEARAARARATALPDGLAEALQVEAAAGAQAGPDGEAAAARTHALVLDALPALRVGTLAGPDPFARWLFDTPLPLARMPRLASAFEALAALLADAGVPLAPALDVDQVDDLLDAPPTLGQLVAGRHFGGVFPLFLALPHDLAALADEVAAAPEPWAAVDHRLAGAILHEALHFGRRRDALFPPGLDEAVAAWLGATLDRAGLFPEPGADCNGHGFTWYSQVGHLLAATFGARPLIQAQAGLASWDTALPPALTTALERQAVARWREHPTPNFAGDPTRTDRVAHLAAAAAAGEDVSAWSQAEADAVVLSDWPAPAADEALELALLRDACAAMALRSSRCGLSLRVQAWAPPGGILLDFGRARATRAAPPGPLDLAPPVHVLPLALSARLRAAGRFGYHVTLDRPGLAACEAVAAAVAAGRAQAEGPGWAIEALSARALAGHPAGG